MNNKRQILNIHRNTVKTDVIYSCTDTDQMKQMMTDLDIHGGLIISEYECTPEEIIIAKQDDRFFILQSGAVYIRRTQEWLDTVGRITDGIDRLADAQDRQNKKIKNYDWRDKDVQDY